MHKIENKIRRNFFSKFQKNTITTQTCRNTQIQPCLQDYKLKHIREVFFRNNIYPLTHMLFCACSTLRQGKVLREFHFYRRILSSNRAFLIQQILSTTVRRLQQVLKKFSGLIPVSQLGAWYTGSNNEMFFGYGQQVFNPRLAFDTSQIEIDC